VRSIGHLVTGSRRPDGAWRGRPGR
jgi:hypothetical protein